MRIVNEWVILGRIPMVIVSIRFLRWLLNKIPIWTLPLLIDWLDYPAVARKIDQANNPAASTTPTESRGLKAKSHDYRDREGAWRSITSRTSPVTPTNKEFVSPFRIFFNAKGGQSIAKFECHSAWCRLYRSTTRIA